MDPFANPQSTLPETDSAGHVTWTCNYPGSLAWAVVRVVDDAVRSGRMSPTEVAVIRDFVFHDDIPGVFRQPSNEGGAKRQERF